MCSMGLAIDSVAVMHVPPRHPGAPAGLDALASPIAPCKSQISTHSSTSTRQQSFNPKKIGVIAKFNTPIHYL